MKKLILASSVIGIACIIFSMYVYIYQKQIIKNLNNIENNNSKIIASVLFNCAYDKSISAIFYDDKVELALSDGRNLLLNQAISASGARYVNNDESIIFWTKGNTALIDEVQDETYQDCFLVDSK